MGKAPEYSKEDLKQLEKFFKKREDEAIKAMTLVVRRFRTRLDNTAHLWNGLRKDRNGSQFSFLLIEAVGGATFPRAFLMNDAKNDVNKLEKAVASREWKRIPKLMKSAELRVNRFNKATTEYWNDISSGSDRAIFWTKFAQGVGMAATVALCTTFAAPAVAARLAAMGITHGLAVSAAQAAAGGMLATQVKGVSTGAGKLMNGIKIDPYRSGMKQVQDTVEAGLWGLICGPTGKIINDNCARGAASALKTRASVAQVKGALVRTWDEMKSKNGKKVARSVALKLSGGETMDKVNELITMEALKDKAFLKRLEENIAKAGK